MSFTTEQLRELSKKLVENPESVNELEPEQSAEIRKFLNPLGAVIPAKKTYANMTLVNWRERYLRRLHMTGFVGYLGRVAKEFVPEKELERERKRYEKEVESVKSGDKSQLDTLKSEHETRMKIITSTAQSFIEQFLNRNFDYNPDLHLRGSHSENPADPERKPKLEAIKEAIKTAESADSIEDKLNSKPDATYKYMRSHLLTTYQAALETMSTVKNAIAVLADAGNNTTADAQGILLKKYKQLKDITTDMKKIVEPIAAADTLSAWKMDPPVDVFHQFDRYLTNHYEQLNEVVTALYNEKSDIEYAVILYDAFKTPEAAREYRVQHDAEFRTEVFTVENGAVTLLGPFKENRQRLDFYNKNTEVLKRMMEQLEADHKLGKDLMEKQVKAKKRKNIEEAGPDAPGLAAYAKSMNVVQELGAKKVLTQDEMKQLAEAKSTANAIKEDLEVPDDAIQMDVFYPDANGNLAKTKFYTQAEAPLHLQEGSQYAEQYQPKRGDEESLDTAYRTKTVTSRTGQKMEIRVPASDTPQ